MAALRDRLSAVHGVVLNVAGQPLAVLPTPQQMLAIPELPGLSEVKLRRLHGVAEEALAGRLDTEELRALPPTAAAVNVQALEGIGPFYADLVVIRALGHTDLLPLNEPRVLDIAGRLLGYERALTTGEYEHEARRWAPWRTWATVAVRAAGPHILDGSTT
jgi:DNA-3-methyladenine glycosylase II